MRQYYTYQQQNFIIVSVYLCSLLNHFSNCCQFQEADKEFPRDFFLIFHEARLLSMYFCEGTNIKGKLHIHPNFRKSFKVNSTFSGPKGSQRAAEEQPSQAVPAALGRCSLWCTQQSVPASTWPHRPTQISLLFRSKSGPRVFLYSVGQLHRRNFIMAISTCSQKF